MQDGLQYCKADGGFYYFDDNGYQKAGRVTSVENDDDDYTSTSTPRMVRMVLATLV